MKPRRFGSYEWVLLINTFVDSGTGLINFTNSLFLQSVILFTICKTTAFCSSLTPGVNSRSNVSSGLKILIAASNEP